jgi:CubicO group peptidase (beta-lactamase class C family)
MTSVAAFRRILPRDDGFRTGRRSRHGVSQQRKPTLAGVVKLLVHDGAPGALVILRTPTKVRRAARGLWSRGPRVRLRATAGLHIASVTKAFVASTGLELVGEGKLARNRLQSNAIRETSPMGEDSVTSA